MRLGDEHGRGGRLRRASRPGLHGTPGVSARGMCQRRRQRRDVRASRIPPATDSLNPLSAVLASLIQRLRVPKCHARAILTVKPPSSRPDGSVRVVDPGTGITTERTGDPALRARSAGGGPRAQSREWRCGPPGRSPSPRWTDPSGLVSSCHGYDETTRAGSPHSAGQSGANTYPPHVFANRC